MLKNNIQMFQEKEIGQNKIECLFMASYYYH